MRIFQAAYSGCLQSQVKVYRTAVHIGGLRILLGPELLQCPVRVDVRQPEGLLEAWKWISKGAGEDVRSSERAEARLLFLSLFIPSRLQACCWCPLYPGWVFPLSKSIIRT